MALNLNHVIDSITPTTGTLSVSSNLTVSGNLIITGNLVTENVQSLEVADPLIILGLGNYTSDLRDIGFAGHYNDGTNAHAGLIRDSNTKEWYLFKGYTPELDANNNVVITDPSFSKANLNADVVRANLIATTAVIGGTDFASYVSITQGVDNTQNTNITAVNNFAAGAFNKANTGGTFTDNSTFQQNLVVSGNLSVGTANTLNKFEVSGNSGQLFTVSDSLTGTIFSVNDVSGIPSIEVLDTGLIKLGQYGGNIVLGSNTDNSNNKLQVTGNTSITGNTSSVSNTTGVLVVRGGLGLSGNLSMNLASSVGVSRLTLNQNAFIVAGDGVGNLAIGGSAYWYFNNTGGIYNQNTLIQRGLISKDTGNLTVLFAGSSPVKIQNGTASSNTTTGALIVQGGVGISGALNATTKSFNISHPTKEGKNLRYGSLEGPEFGVYVRGTLKGSNTIELPDYWTKLVDANTITVSLTPIGKYQKLSVKEIKDNTIIINSDGWFKKEIHCYYTVFGERADVDKLDVEV